MVMNQQQNEASEAVCKELLTDGWREYPNQFKQYARCFYKRFATPTRCHGNNDKEGVQIEMAVSSGFSDQASLEMTLCAGLQDETWLSIQNYALPQTVKRATVLIPRLLAAWESANAAVPIADSH